MRLVRPWVWVAVFVAIVAVFFVLPQVSLAGDPLDTPLVPVCDSAEDGGFIGACQLCDLVKLARNIINFSIAFSMVVATLLFAYAGFMYYTAASSPDNIKKAHGVFTKTFTGIIIILAAWLVINLLMITISGNEWSLSDDIQCIDYPTSGAFPRGSAVTGGGSGSLSPRVVRCANCRAFPASVSVKDGTGNTIDESVYDSIVGFDTRVAAAGINGGQVTEGYPPSTGVHGDTCHYNGTCIDYSLGSGHQYTDEEIVAVIRAGGSDNIVVFESTDPAQIRRLREQVLPQANIRAGNAVYVSYATGSHFSVYPRGCQGSPNSVCNNWGGD